MMKITYAVSEEKYVLGNDSRISYGIVAYSDTEQNGSKTIIASVRDITSDKQSLSKLIDDCNKYELSIVYLSDVVEDFLRQ